MSYSQSEREVALLYGAIGGIEKVVESIQPVEEEEEEENEMGDKEVFIPTSFGAPSEIYGKQLGKIDESIFREIVASLKKQQRSSAVADVFVANEKVSDWAEKYAGKKSKFLKDLPEAYEKVMALGGRYTGGKVDNLLGNSDIL